MPSVQASAGASHTGRRGRVRVATSLSEINVVPLVDVMLVLLVIFMVTAPMMQRGLDVALPESRRADAISEERLFVTVPLSYRTDQRVMIDDDSVPLDVLAERMRQALLTREDKEVFLRGDGGIQLSELMEVMDRLKEAGVQRVGIMARYPDR